MRIATAGFTLVALAFGSARGQTVPATAFEVTGGLGSHTASTPTVNYGDALTHFFRAGATIRLGPSGAMRPVLVLEASPGCVPGVHCESSNSCAPPNPFRGTICDYPAPAGYGAALGVAGSWSAAVVTVAAGAASYARPARFVDASVAVAMWPDVAIVGAVRYMTTSDDAGNREWMRPISLGIRIF